MATDVAAAASTCPPSPTCSTSACRDEGRGLHHRIGRTGRAGCDGLAVTFAEFRDRRKIFDIEGYSQQRLKTETMVPGLSPPSVSQG